MAKKDLIKDAKSRGIALTGDETVADLKALLKAAGEKPDEVDAEAGDDVDAIDADIESLKAQLAERLRAKAVAVDRVEINDAQAEQLVQQHADEVAVQLENERRKAEHDATQEALERARAAGGTTTPQGVHFASGCI